MYERNSFLVLQSKKVLFNIIEIVVLSFEKE